MAAAQLPGRRRRTRRRIARLHERTQGRCVLDDPSGRRRLALFNNARTETTITHLAEEANVPGALRRLALHAELERLRKEIATPAPVFMTEADPVLRVFVQLAGESAPVEVRREDIYLCEIPDDVELASPVPSVLVLDPSSGRIAFPAALTVQQVWVQSSYGFSGDLGGGPYDRSAAVRAANQTVAIDVSAAGNVGGFFDIEVWQVGVSHLTPDDGSQLVRVAARSRRRVEPAAARHDRRHRADGQPERPCR
jgi:hypothetical protein